MLRAAETINLVYFALLVGLSFAFPLPSARRLQIASIGAAGSLLVLGGVGASLILPERVGWILRDWLPAGVLLVAYWQAGRFFTGPNLRLQQFLVDVDRRAAAAWKRRAGARVPEWIEWYFERVYVAAYPLVPLGLATLYVFGYDDYADYFWSVVLPAAYVCYLMLPFAPTLPPRLRTAEGRDMIGAGQPGRGLNLRILDRLGIGANTFPSGHAAATTAAALVVAEFAPAAGLLFLWVALSIAAGIVVRRYHYLADSILGVLVALVVWALVRAAVG